MELLVDRGDSYKVGYLGSATLSQMATGIGALQKPLWQLYTSHRKPGKGTLLAERHLSMTSDGMIMSFKEAPHYPPRQEYYPMTEIVLWDAVRFISVKNPEKKDKKSVKFAFEPLDNDHSRNKVNLFSTMDKKYHYLQQQQHPPIFTCVLRRKAGVKSLDVHAFFCSSDEEALGIVRALNCVHDSFTSNQTQETGVFGYSPFGKASVRTPGGPMSLIQKSMASPSSVPTNTQQSQSIPATSVAQVKHQSQHNVTSIPNSRGQPLTTSEQNYQYRHEDKRSSNIFAQQQTPSPYNSGDNRGRFGNPRQFYQLSQEDLLSPKLSVAPSSDLDSRLNENELEDDGYQYLPHITHSLERRNNERVQHEESNQFPQFMFHKSYGTGNSDDLKVTDVDAPLDNTPDSENVVSRFVSKPDFEQTHSEYSENKPFNYLGGNKSSSPKKVNTSGDSSREGSVSKMGQGYSLLSHSNDRPQSRHVESSVPPHFGSAKSPTSPQQPFENSGSLENNRQIFKELLHIQKQQQKGNLGDSASHGKQIRPPKSPGYLERPPSTSSAKREDKDSPEDNTSLPGPSSGSIVKQSPIIEPFKTKDNPSKGDQPAVKSKPIARVPPHMVTGVRVLPLNPSSTGPKRSTTENDLVSPTKGERPKSGIFLQSPTSPDKGERFFASPPRRSQSQYNVTNELSVFEDSSSKQKSSKGNWQFGPTKGSSRESSLKSRSQQQQRDLDNNMDDKLGEKLLLSKKKDAEIASVMQNLRLDYKDTPTLTPGAPGGMNFEKSLGYFP